MDQQQLAILHEQYHDYFIVEQTINVNIRLLDFAVPDEDSFERMIPEPFKMAGELAALEQSSLKSLNRLGELADELAQYLRAQARKIDTMMRYILQQQDEPAMRHQTHSFGGSALCFYSNERLEPGQLLEVKLFLNQSDGAVYCLAQVLDSEQTEQQWLVRSSYCRIRDVDRELVVRASLHEQSRQLKRKAELRQLQGNR